MQVNDRSAPTLQSSCHDLRERLGMKRLRLALFRCLSLCFAGSASAGTVLEDYLPDAVASDLVPGADGFGAVRDDLAAAPVLKGGQTIGWVFVTSDFVGTTGYSGK